MKFLENFGYAWKGLKVAVKEETHLRIHLAATVIVIFMGFYFRVSPGEWLILLTMIGLTIGFELLNTAIENLTDLVTKEKLPLAGKVKDISAAAVAVVSVVALMVGLIIFTKYIIE